MTNRSDVIDESRRWKGTPWVHQGHTRGLGCDCAGLVGGVAVSLGIVPADWWDFECAPHSGYSRQPLGNGLIVILDNFMHQISLEMAQPGDVLVMRFRRDPQHLAILAPYATGGRAIVHALSNPGCVVEHRLDDRWMARVTHAYSYPGVD